jgi:hypothetical protein
MSVVLFQLSAEVSAVGCPLQYIGIKEIRTHKYKEVKGQIG